MQRNQNWPEALHDHFLTNAERPFELGQHDCLLHVCDAVHAMTGIDPAATFRGKYSTELGFLRIVKARGHESLEHMVEALAKEHGIKEVGVKYAQRGDIVLFDNDGDIAFGIVHHNGIDSVCVGPHGLRRLRTLTARRAWHVGL